eukprot:628869-Rhodomonas_salina.1
MRPIRHRRHRLFAPQTPIRLHRKSSQQHQHRAPVVSLNKARASRHEVAVAPRPARTDDDDHVLRKEEGVWRGWFVFWSFCGVKQCEMRE